MAINKTTIIMKYKDAYEAPTAEPVEILMENYVLQGSAKTSGVRMESMEIDDAELDW